MKSIHLTHNMGTYPIYVGNHFINNEILVEEYSTLANRFIVLSDDNVVPLYANRILQQFDETSCHLITIPAGEKSKSREMKHKIEDKMLALGCGRDTMIIAVGGGVVTDLAGFIAATYCRGIPVIYVPTTLLAMVDAAIGGKTAVNTPLGKNLIGSFYHPSQVYCDITTLNTLSSDNLSNGLVEAIKHALIADKDFFFWLDGLLTNVNPKKFDNNVLETLVTQSCQIKCNIVAEDEHESGKRQLLNFGHTIAHGIEALFDYTVSHGQAVLAGLIIESYLSYLLGYLKRDVFVTIINTLRKIPFSTPLALSRQQFSQLKQIVKRDKKSVNQQARYVLLNTIGDTQSENSQFSFPVEEKLVDEALQYWSEHLQ